MPLVPFPVLDSPMAEGAMTDASSDSEPPSIGLVVDFVARLLGIDSIVGKYELSESEPGSSGAFITKWATERVAVVDSVLDCLSWVSIADGGNWAGWESSSSVASESGISTDDLALVDVGGEAVAWELISSGRRKKSLRLARWGTFGSLAFWKKGLGKEVPEVGGFAKLAGCWLSCCPLPKGLDWGSLDCIA